MKQSNYTLNGQPKKLSKGRSFSQTTKAPKLKGMAGFSNFGRVGGKVVPGKDCC